MIAARRFLAWTARSSAAWAAANIAAFHTAILERDYGNPTVAPSVQSNLVTILGRKSAYENRLVTWDELMKDGERLTPNLKGLKD